MLKTIIFLLMITLLCSCSDNVKPIKIKPTPELNLKKLHFDLELNRDVYLNSIYGESPQIAIWIEDSSKTILKNVYATYRTGKNDWVGKVNCKVSLPYWKSRLEYFSDNKKIWQNEIDAITKPTSSNDNVNASIYVDENSIWNFFIEVNVAGDYNFQFSTFLPNGIPDTEGNGQPSIIYSNVIEISSGKSSIPKIIGRSDQTKTFGMLIEDLSGITSIKEIFKSINVKVE